MKKMMALGLTLVAAFIYFYVALPAINIQSGDFYVFLIFTAAIYKIFDVFLNISSPKIVGKKEKIIGKIPLIIFAGISVFLVIGIISSMEIFRAGAYRSLLTVENGNFTEDIAEISFDKIPSLDRDSSIMLGDRKLGELSDMVSQFEVSDNYTQINYNNKPVRVTPLKYGDLIKWFTNQKEGIPAYIVLDMVTQEADVIRLDDGMKYSQSEIFNRNIGRHIRFNYPTYMFDTPTFEINDEGIPYWICPRIVKKIGLFGGTDINGAVLVNAITGECEYYENVPNWVDRVYNADLIVQQYDYYGTFVNGFFNSMFGQRDVTVTTSGYNYIALNDDVYLYTGITSVGGDQSNIGFILSNQRTKETKFYSIAGATEESAMKSAEGIVQHLNYKSTFPLLLNIASEPTYFVALKDNATLVKMYAMVNVSQYQIVATGKTIQECENEYIRLLKEKELISDDVTGNTKVRGNITDIRNAVKEGTTYYYVKLDTSEYYYQISALKDERVVLLNIGDTIELEYSPSSTDIFSIYKLELVTDEI